ncbi:TldD/PmbA family protein [Lichenicoccus roseus]|uniref:TldD/PmbA family protein n=1 Tax=Lichenicoccus roseus TaxID=2683649 RepID=A0A5R9J9P9_9PROT|nr:TldD/PmbA family protein [Lichenicoccus roseus]TLU73729.1 TldD/PmbA family protein [Lichenicoccus roseus]
MSGATDAGEGLIERLVSLARSAGADAADAVLIRSTAVGVQVRQGKTEELERSESSDVGLRVFVGGRSAIVSATSLDPSRFEALAEQAIAMARVVPEDRWAGLCDASAPGIFDAAGLELADPTEPDMAALVTRAGIAEAAALAVTGVANSLGASASFGRTEVVLATSRGFTGRYARTSHSVSAAVLAGSGTTMQRDYDGHSVVFLEDLDDPATIGHSAGERAVARMHPTKPKTGRMPVVYDPRVSGSLLGHLAGAINGAAVARGTSFLKDRMGARILREGLHVTDDPRRRRGLRSRPFDGEGVATSALVLVEDGILRSWVLDGRSARQLGLATNGHASRGPSSPPGPSITNLSLSPGALTPAELMADIREGLYITEMMGSAVNGITGDYSRGASGFMIRDGALAEPVAEITVAGNLLPMLAEMTPANDLTFRRGTDAPTIRIDGLTVAGA